MPWEEIFNWQVRYIVWVVRKGNRVKALLLESSSTLLHGPRHSRIVLSLTMRIGGRGPSFHKSKGWSGVCCHRQLTLRIILRRQFHSLNNLGCIPCFTLLYSRKLVLVLISRQNVCFDVFKELLIDVFRSDGVLFKELCRQLVFHARSAHFTILINFYQNKWSQGSSRFDNFPSPLSPCDFSAKMARQQKHKGHSTTTWTIFRLKNSKRCRTRWKSSRSVCLWEGTRQPK